MRGSQNKYKKYEKVNTADPWKMTEYFPERNDLGYLKLTNRAVCSSKVLKLHVLAHKTAFCTVN